MISNGSASAAITINSEIPRFRVLVAEQKKEEKAQKVITTGGELSQKEVEVYSVILFSELHEACILTGITWCISSSALQSDPFCCNFILVSTEKLIQPEESEFTLRAVQMRVQQRGEEEKEEEKEGS
ncbi:hypothetical protein Baya_5554 [Bagarius yarrelli]|uniref:Uncharacterized protein n=1 Tax=Bagarius yarrelli TaxID=175774 RepID=A0A556TV05_BAGYA|nr:hypothetical protein Baya_5554 [Bagarius yarrelli]